ncbi:MAG: S-layer homology domain-containing protein [Tepidanaerobacteraceae bacterium]
MKKRILLFILILALMSTHVISFASDSVFTDIKPTDWFYNDVVQAQKEGLVQGIGAGKYAPNKTISYAEYITVLVRVLGLDVTDELKGNHWASQYMHAAVKAGILTQEELIDLNYDKGITRQDMIKYTCKALGVKPITTTETIFNDLKDKNDEEVGLINTAFEEYLTEGVGRTPEGLRIFGYDRQSNRAELATMALRIKAYKEDPVEYKKERAAAREAADREWEQKYGAQIKWEQLKKTGITSEDQITPEILDILREKVVGYKTDEWVILNDIDFEGYKNSIINALRNVVKVGNVPIVVSKHLYYETKTSAKLKIFMVIVNGKESWIVNVGKSGNNYKVRDAGVFIEDIFKSNFGNSQ